MTSISFHADVNQYLCGRPSAFIGTYIRTSLDFHQLSYGRPSEHLVTFVSVCRDVYLYLCRHPSAFMWTSIRTSVDVHRLSYGCPSVFKLTPSVFILTLIITSLDVHQLLYGRPSVPTLTSVFIGNQLVPLRPSISIHLDIHHLCGHP